MTLLLAVSRLGARAWVRHVRRLDPDEVVSYGPPLITPRWMVERECPLWWLFCPFMRRRLI